MAYSNQNVIDFKDLQSGKKMATEEINSQLIFKGRRILSTRLSEILKGFFEKVDDELFALSDKAENSTLQTSYFDAMRYIRKERTGMQSHCLNAVERGYDDFWSGSLAQPVSSVETEEGEFSLVDDDELEEDLAITTMIDKCENRYHGDLFALNKRFSVLLKIDEIDKRQNPIAPAQLCQAFKSTLAPLSLALDLKLVIYKLFDRLVLSNMGIVYAESNALLISHGVLPKIQKQIKKQDSSAPDSESSGELVEEALSPEQFELASSLQNLVGAYRQRSGEQYTMNVGSGPVYEINEVIDVLNMAQDNITNNSSMPMLRGEELKTYLTNTLGDMQPSGNQRPFASIEEDVIDMVEMIFDYILEDKNLPDPIRVHLGRLQIPMLKVAVMDKGFFAKKGHAARELLNQLSKAGVELSNDDCEARNPVYVEIEAVVEQVLNEFGKGGELFENLLAKFTEFLERDGKRSQVLEGRTRQVTESKEKLLLAKKLAAYEVAKQMQGKRIPSVVKEFIEGIWKDVVVLTALRVDREPDGLTRSIDVIDRLIGSVTPPSSIEGKQKVLKDIPLLIKELRIGLENISVDSHEMASFFKDLERCHVSSLKRGGAEIEAEQAPQESVLLPVKSEEEIKQECDELFDEVSSPLSKDAKPENKAPSSGSEGYDVEEIVLSSEELVVANDDHKELLAELKVGQWFEVDREDEKTIRVKLSWESQVTSLCVFVDRKGMKMLEISRDNLAAEINRGAVRRIEAESMPLMDRALAAMMTTLKASSDEPETALQ